MWYSAPLLYLLLFACISSFAHRVVAAPLIHLTARALELIVPPNKSDNHWVDSWGAMPLLIGARYLPPEPFTTPENVFANTTLRQTVRLTLGGDLLRLRISNTFGGSDLPITGVSVALPAGGSSGVSEAMEGTSQRVTFGGEESVVVPMGALVVSDPVQFPTPVKATTILTVTIYSKEGQKSNSVTGHPGSRTTSWFVKGEYLDLNDLPSQAQGQVPLGEGKAGIDHWYWLSGVEVWTATTNSAVVIVGDSITDGSGSTVNGNNRWPDLLLNRLLSSTDEPSLQSLSIINQAAGGNRILTEGGGPSALSRIDRDVLAHSSVTHAIIFEGVNDILNIPSDAEAQTALAQRMIWAFKQIVDRIHTHNIVVIGGTISPFSGPGGSDLNKETTRKKVNEWIRTSGAFDAVVDFEKVLADPKNPEQLLEAYDTGDHLHPSVVGFQAMVDAFPLDLFDLRLSQGTRKSKRGIDDFLSRPFGPVAKGGDIPDM